MKLTVKLDVYNDMAKCNNSACVSLNPFHHQLMKQTQEKVKLSAYVKVYLSCNSAQFYPLTFELVMNRNLIPWQVEGNNYKAQPAYQRITEDQNNHDVMNIK